jgi:hypothetical protein
MNFEELERTTSEHIVRYYLDEPLNRDYTCNWCYPPPPFETLPNSFKNFWNWFRREYQADTFTSRTIVAFNLFEQLSNTPESEHRNSRLIRDIYQLLSSIRYLVSRRNIPVHSRHILSNKLFPTTYHLICFFKSIY